MLAQGAEIEGAPHRPLREAVELGSPRIVRLLLDAQASLDAVGDDVEQLVILDTQNAVIMELLLDYGADINPSNLSCRTALMMVAASGHLETVKSLVAKGAKLNLMDTFADSAFSYACLNRHHHIVRYLVGCEGLDINGDIDGWAPFYLTVSCGYNAALKILLQRGASTDRPDYWGQSVLHTAVLRERENVARTLLENGADIEMQDKDGFTPLMTAINIDNVPIVTILHDYWPGCEGSPDRGSRTTVESPLSKGVDINTVDEDRAWP